MKTIFTQRITAKGTDSKLYRQLRQTKYSETVNVSGKKNKV